MIQAIKEKHERKWETGAVKVSSVKETFTISTFTKDQRSFAFLNITIRHPELIQRGQYLFFPFGHLIHINMTKTLYFEIVLKVN